MIPTGRRAREIGLAILQGQAPTQREIEKEFGVGGNKASAMMLDFAHVAEQIAREHMDRIGPLGPNRNREYR